MAEKNNVIYLYGADQPARNDTLHLDAYIAGLVEFIRNCETPMTISLQGSWGSGKSSMMNLLEKELSDRAVCVGFNTWQYSQFDLGTQLPLLLYQSLIEKLGETAQTEPDEQEEKDKRVTEALKKGLVRLGWVAAKRAGVEDVAAAAVTTAKEVRAAWKGDAPEPEKAAPSTLTGAVEGLRESFQELVNARCEQEDKERVVFFIDDLDRLPPARAVELMEVLKTAVECDKCVFVLAIDYEVVLRGVRDKYGADFGAEKGRSFFDKMIQLPFDLPVEQYSMEDFLKDLIESVGDPDCIAALLGQSAPNKEAIHEVKTEVKDTVAEKRRRENKIYVRDMAFLAAGHNPRSLKRLFNAFTLTVRVVWNFKGKPSDGEIKRVDQNEWVLLFGVAALRTAYPKVYDHLLAVCHNGVELGEFYRWFHFDEDWQRLQTRQAAVAQRLGLAGLSDLETDRVRTLVRRLFSCSMLKEEINTNCLPESETGSVKEQWMAVRDGLPFQVDKWQLLEEVLELGAASDWAKDSDRQVYEERMAVLIGLLRTITMRWNTERWTELTPARMERCVEILCDGLRDGERAFPTFAALEEEDGEETEDLPEWNLAEYTEVCVISAINEDPDLIENYRKTHRRAKKTGGYTVEGTYAYSAVWGMICRPELALFPRDFRLLVEKVRKGGDTLEQDMDALAKLLAKVLYTDKPLDPDEVAEVRREAMSCLEPGK